MWFGLFGEKILIVGKTADWLIPYLIMYKHYIKQEEHRGNFHTFKRCWLSECQGLSFVSLKYINQHLHKQPKVLKYACQGDSRQSLQTTPLQNMPTPLVIPHEQAMLSIKHAHIFIQQLWCQISQQVQKWYENVVAAILKAKAHES